MLTLLKDQAYDKILDMIQTGEIRYGETYSLSQITNQLQMSRTPVRDALHKLCDEHRLDILPSRGFRLHELSEDEYTLRYHFSNAIEGYCCGWLAEHMNEDRVKEQVDQLQAIQDMLRQLAGRKADFKEFYNCDNLFHLQLLQSLGDNFYKDMLNMRGMYNMPQIHQTRVPVDRDKILECHDRIIDCIRSGDPDAAFHAMLDHSELMFGAFKKSIDSGGPAL